MRLLDKYILKSFLVPFLLCFFGFLAIWLVFDLSDNAADFIEAKVKAKVILQFYLVQLPQITMVSLPVGLLLALLYSMSRMARTNEIISMLTAGRSLGRVCLPLILVGVFLTGVSTVLNYKLAPQAASLKEQIRAELRGKKQKKRFIESQLFRNRAEGRTWYVQRMPSRPDNDAVLDGLHISEQDAEGNILTKWYARRATYKEESKTWQFTRGKTVKFDAAGNILSDKPWQTLEISNWRETPWRIASSTFEPESLSVPELRAYLKYNADFPPPLLAPYLTHLNYRWALPWTCLVVVLIAAPLGIVFSRRGMVTSVAAAIFLFAAQNFSTNLMLALGKGDRLPAVVAAWLPNALFAAIGLYLLYLRSTNRDLPNFGKRFRAK
jgi:lipopolysaccharide export system permease protein